MILSKYIINYICLRTIINVVYKLLLSSVKVDMFTKLLFKFWSGLCVCLAFANVAAKSHCREIL